MSDDTQVVTTNPEVENAAVLETVETDAADAVVAEDNSLQKQIADLRKEAAKWRTKVREFEKQQQAQAEELERKKPLEEKLSTYEQKLSELQAQRDALEARTIANEMKNNLLEAGVNREYLEDAFQLYVAAVERSEEGEEPEIADFLKSKPYLVAKQQTAQPIAGANPAGKTMSAATTRQDIAKMTADEYKAQRSRLFGLMSRGNIR